VADFRAELPASLAVPVSVRFEDASAVPAPTAWRWEFGDGAVSEERDPVHVYQVPGTYDVRLTVSGSGGPAVRQKPAVVTVEPADRATNSEGARPRPAPRIVGVRP
jgi:PKD repeat protein